MLFGTAVVPVSTGSSDTVDGDSLTRDEFETSACFFPHRYKTEEFILLHLLLTPDWINDHLS